MLKNNSSDSFGVPWLVRPTSAPISDPVGPCLLCRMKSSFEFFLKKERSKHLFFLLDRLSFAS